ncbi:MAG: hypothetical protein DDT40_01783 [candidate division WS2 bacterium]|uniref:SCP2 domain-containing protein n=2 Tax=Bacteria TaxID=2 RepID=A0A9E2F280_PSYF1|nr:hypothetical protein [Candidatus Psychracetigena formicireducens]MBT9151587.1 hypothetical protein [Candidatus Psychracetigena formicireducens]RII00405.1 MAG: hypothetical protein B9J77_02675 [candidate division NPL-UPA2 bacterium Unc8]
MNKEKIKSYLYLHAILPQLEEILEFDEEAGDIAKNWNASIRLGVKSGPRVSLIFKNGRLGIKREKAPMPTVGLFFLKHSSLNKMFEGKQIIPLVWKGFWCLSLLKGFSRLTKKMERYLRPDEEFLKTEENLKFYLKVTLYTLLWGIKVVGENDGSFKIKRANATISRFPSGVFQVEILPDGPCGYITMADGKFLPSKGKHPSPTSTFQIKNASIAYKMFQGEIDFMVGLGTMDLRIVGLVSFAEAMSIIMEKLMEYLPGEDK